MLKKSLLVACSLFSTALFSFDLCLATYYPFVDNHHYLDWENYGTLVAPADIDKRGFDGSTFKYGEAASAYFINAYIDEHNALSFQLGYGMMKIDWNENPYFNQKYFHDAVFSIAYVSTGLDKWRWIFNLGAHIDAEHWDPINYAFYNFTMWGRCQALDKLGIHVGMVATSGNERTQALPILGIDWDFLDKWRLALVYPCEGSLNFTPYPFWTISGTYRGFGGYYKSFHRTGANQPLPKAVVSVFSTGFDLGMTFRNKSAKLEIYGGYNLGGWMLIENQHGDHKQYVHYDGAPYGGLQASVAF
ncbi:MAG TPA: hypothetical protein PLO43_01130 [Chlamydiales bacterium]|nr:hypothetical protein [Chlamydiales bacterium]HPE84767.1 hypothetical protein [Chlamydiales bacterium]